MKIMFFTDYFHPEPCPPAAHIYDRCRIWAAQGHQVTVVTSCPNFPHGEPYEGYRNVLRSIETMEGVRVIRVKTYMAENKGAAKRGLDQLSYAFSSFVQAWREPKPEAVISSSPPLFASLGALLYAKSRGLPHTMEVRDIWPASMVPVIGLNPNGRLYRILEWLELRLYRWSSHVVPVTHTALEDMAGRGVPREKLTVVPNSADLELFADCGRDQDLARRLGLEGKFVVGYVGAIGGAHGLAAAIGAAEILSARRPEISFLLVGDGAEKAALEERARSKNLKNVVFTGRLPKSDMPRMWGLCDVALVHLKDDPVFSGVIPTKTLEAFAAGKPVIYAVTEGEGSRIVREAEAGLILPPESPEAIADAAEKLLDDAALRERLTLNAKAASSRFSRRGQAEATLAVLAKTLTAS